MTFVESLDYLESLKPETNSKWHVASLDRINELLDKLGNPHKGLKYVHVGGTAGKGSTCYMIAEILKTAGYKTGLHVSPHLEDVRERMQINGKFMDEEKFVEYANLIQSVVETMRSSSKNGAPSYFEALLAITFLYFRDENVDIAVIEVGMGGTLDGTNVITPLVAVLTNVGLDHTQILGDTVEKIAKDKVGIFKKGIDAVSGVTQPSVRAIVQAKATELSCDLTLVDEDFDFELDKGTPNTVRVMSNNGKTLAVPLASQAPYQAENAALAIIAVQALEKHGLTIPDDAIKSALQSVTIPGRFEVFSTQTSNHEPRTIILDGAHNPDKMDALVEALVSVFQGQKIRFIFAAKKDKNIAEMIKILEPIAKKFYFTKFLQSTDFGKDFSFDPYDFSTIVDHETFASSDQALRKVLEESASNDLICVTGSLYLVGELRSKFIKS